MHGGPRQRRAPAWNPNSLDFPNRCSQHWSMSADEKAAGVMEAKGTFSAFVAVAKRSSVINGQKQTLVHLGGIALAEALAQGNSQIAYDDRGGEKTHQTKVSTKKVNCLVNQFPLGATKKPLFLGSDEGRSLPCYSVLIGSRGRA